MVATAAQAVAACGPPAAVAATWQPRRHAQNTLREKYVSQETPQQAAARKAARKEQAAAQAAAAAARKAEQEASLSSVQRMVRDTQRQLKQMWREKPVYSVGVHQSRASAYSSGRPPAPSTFGWVPLALAAGAAAFLMFGRNLQWPWGGRRSAGGRWVRDRSLGGKMVFIPDADLPGGAAAPKPPRPLFEDPDDGEAAAAVAAGSGEAAGPWAATAAAAPPPAGDELPSWWSRPSFLVYTPFTRKEELQRQARMVLRQLEDAKLLQGLDYPVSGLVSLRTLCQEAGGYQVKPRTESGRDAMLRAGVRAAIAAGQEGAYGLLGGDKPARFVCGLAHDLGVPEKRTVVIVHAEVAAICRAALIDAEAAYRSSDNSDLLLALIKIAGALQTFPLPAGSAEAELVAAGVMKQMGLELRRALFFEFGAVSPQLAALVAEMLGFNPQLVMPYLLEQQRLEAEEKAATTAAAQQQLQQAGEQ